MIYKQNSGKYIMKTLLHNIYIQDLKQLTYIFENSHPARHTIYLK